PSSDLPKWRYPVGAYGPHQLCGELSLTIRSFPLSLVLSGSVEGGGDCLRLDCGESGANGYPQIFDSRNAGIGLLDGYDRALRSRKVEEAQFKLCIQRSHEGGYLER